MLRSQINRMAVGQDAEASFRALHGGEPVAHFEHGHWWITDKRTGAQYDAVDATGPGTCSGWGFEQVTEGEEG